MALVKDVLREKGNAVFGIKRAATVYAAIEEMVRHNVGSLVVMDDDAIPCGIITERDYLREVALKGRTSKMTRVDEIMSQRITCVGPKTDIDECLRIMTERRIRHLPVMNDGHLSGIVSIGDCVKQKMLEQRIELENMTEYIRGNFP